MNKPKLWLRLVALAVIAALVAMDQLVKVWAQGNLQGTGRQVLLPGVLGLLYAENPGISFGMLGQNTTAMLIVTVITGVIMLAGLVWMMLGRLETLSMWSAVLIIGGGLGNFIDRVAQGYVVDYIEFLFIQFAIFNLADVFITVGMVGLIIATIITERRKARAA